ncbi:Os03g0254475 [Oryza sativa Japonica Group]|uniref:Os03g0254475 protein n=1 Tax=Oryza sativa subsp. japonica TaxID=39947 RepID=A0A0P0VVW6_ORYSJ|nr:Os03g0254475 [Oryza sativa Japonica Group]
MEVCIDGALGAKATGRLPLVKSGRFKRLWQDAEKQDVPRSFGFVFFFGCVLLLVEHFSSFDAKRAQKFGKSRAQIKGNQITYPCQY